MGEFIKNKPITIILPDGTEETITEYSILSPKELAEVENKSKEESKRFVKELEDEYQKRFSDIINDEELNLWD